VNSTGFIFLSTFNTLSRSNDKVAWPGRPAQRVVENDTHTTKIFACQKK
jgi:hypothetical protein